MNFKKSFLILLFPALFFCASLNSFSQTKQKIVLRRVRGESGKAVSGRVRGTIKDADYRDYFFTIPKGRGVDISVSTDSGEAVKFDVISPKGKKLFENETDILDDLPAKGTYTIRVYRTKDSSAKGGVSRFQLGIFMYI